MPFNSKLNRRDFLKLTGAGLVSLLLPRIDLRRVSAQENVSQRGRVMFQKVSIYNIPSTQGVKINTFYRDTLLPISGEVTGGEEGDYNRTWYRIGRSGYVYSGGIQLVENVLNPIVYDIPASGMIGELSIPYAEAWWGIHRTDRAPAYRLYYQSTHWIKDVFRDPQDGSQWYRVYDHLYDAYYYVRPQYIRLIAAQDLSPISTHVPPDQKSIHILLDEQVLVAYEGQEKVHLTRTATGKQGAETPTGTFTTFHKRPTAHMVGGDGITSMYDLAGVPWDTYITEDGIAMHGTFWHNDFGSPRSFGCINLTPSDARWIYRWTLPVVPADKNYLYEPGSGTRVIIAQNESSLQAMLPTPQAQSTQPPSIPIKLNRKRSG